MRVKDSIREWISQRSTLTRLFDWIAIFVAITSFYIIDQPLPTGWWDQGKYLEATRAFSNGDWTSAHHWYPPGYSLLGVPFLGIFPEDPFVVVDLLCLIGSLLAMKRLAVLMELPAIVGLGTFLFTSVINHAVLQQYVIPWTDTPTGCLTLIGFCLCLSPPNKNSSFSLGIIVGLILIIKPIDDISLIPVGFYYSIRIIRNYFIGRSFLNLGLNVLYGIIPLVFFIASTILIHFKIYGWHLSEYEAQTTDGPVFLMDQIGPKIYSIFFDPLTLYSYFHGGLAQNFPWLTFGLCGMIFAIIKKLSLASLSASVLLYVIIYSSYTDLDPRNIWRYYEIHYFIWTFPVFFLFFIYILKNIFINKSILSLFIVLSVNIFILNFHPYLCNINEINITKLDKEINLDLSECAAPCVLDIDTAKPVFDDQDIRDTDIKNISFDSQTLYKIGERSFRIFAHNQGIRILMLRTNELSSVKLIVPEDNFLKIEKIHISFMKWKYFLSFIPAYAIERPSFDCDRAYTKAEYVVCSNAGLSKQDRHLAILVKKIRDRSKDWRLDEFLKGQRTWMKLRNKAACIIDDRKVPLEEQVKCLENVYAERIVELNALVMDPPSAPTPDFDETLNRSYILAENSSATSLLNYNGLNKDRQIDATQPSPRTCLELYTLTAGTWAYPKDVTGNNSRNFTQSTCLFALLETLNHKQVEDNATRAIFADLGNYSIEFACLGIDNCPLETNPVISFSAAGRDGKIEIIPNGFLDGANDDQKTPALYVSKLLDRTAFEIRDAGDPQRSQSTDNKYVIWKSEIGNFTGRDRPEALLWLTNITHPEHYDIFLLAYIDPETGIVRPEYLDTNSRFAVKLRGLQSGMNSDSDPK